MHNSTVLKEVATRTILEIARESNGYVTAAQATAEGIPRRLLTKMVSEGELVYVDRGLYSLPTIWADPFLVAQHRFSRGTFSDDTALFLHGMTDRTPFSLTMTFPRSYNKTKAKSAGITCRSCADGVLSLGIMEIETSYGNTVRAYDLERTLCDLLRGQRVIDDQLVSPAMQRYVRLPQCDPVKLVDYARRLGVEAKIRTYLKVLL